MSERVLKTDFTEIEIQRIKDLINQKNATDDQNEQKKIRQKIRNIGFYAEDHGIKKGEYTVENFLKAISKSKNPQQMEFWHLQMSKGLTDDRELRTADVREILQNKEIIGTGEWKDNREDQCMRFKDHLKVGDIVMVRNGGSPIALVQVTGENVQWDVYENQRAVRILSFFNNNIESKIGRYNGQTRGTLERVANKNTSTGSFVVNWYNLILDEMEHSGLIDLLKQKHQIILQGPPGTGKTYTAKDLAEKLIFGNVSSKEDQKQRLASTEQFRMIQFHPAYSYEDFVRGIEARVNGSQVEYRTENRVLAEMAQKALNNFEDSKKNPEKLTEEMHLNEAFNQFAAHVEEVMNANPEGKFPLGELNTYISEVNKDHFIYKGDNWTSTPGYRMYFADIKAIFNANVENQNEIPHLETVSATAKQRPGYYFRVFQLFSQYKEENYVPAEITPSIDEKPFVLVIDEINRANLPSVLGELIYALEYRGEAVDSMYEKDGEGRKITIPPNLYIIGTMNTADRSVGHIDYAIRRRFAFVDVLPNQEPIKEFARETFVKVSSLFIDKPDEYLLDNANKIEKSEYLSPDFRPEDVWIGHSYFITKEDGEEGKKELKIKLKYEVVPLLKEYIKDSILSKKANDIIETL